MFKNRKEAGKELARAARTTLRGFIDPGCTVVGLNHGGTIVGGAIASELNCPLDVMVSSTICNPDRPDELIAGVSVDGEIVVDGSLDASVSEEYLDERAKALIAELRESEARIRSVPDNVKDAPLEGRWVILASDVVSNGLEVLAGIQRLRKQAGISIALAAPVIDSNAENWLRDHTDVMISLQVEPEMKSSNEYFVDFPEIGDSEVRMTLSSINSNIIFKSRH